MEKPEESLNETFIIPVKKRVIKKIYTKKYEEQQKIKILKRQQRENIIKKFYDIEEILSLDGKKLIYDNQKKASDECEKAFDEGCNIVLLIAQPGTGKTGTVQSCMKTYATNDDDEKIVMAQDICIASGMSDNDWEYQFKKNLIPEFRDNVFHRQNFMKHTKKLEEMRNGLIILDECHIASGSKMTIAKTLDTAGLLDVEVLNYRKIKLLDISATPESVLYDSIKWGDKARVVKIEPGPNYKGFETMLKEKRIFESPNLDTYDEVYDFLSFLDERYKETTKKYYPFRLLDENKKSIITDICQELEWDRPLIHDSNSRIENIDKLMENPPSKHTVIFIKGFWRASKRLIRENVGATYEAIPKKQDVTSTSQGLTARFCDNYEYSGDQLDLNKRPLHYCDKEAIQKYIDWFNNDCDYTTSEYQSNRIKSSGKGKVTSKPSKIHPSIISNLPESPKNSEENKEEKIKQYRIYDNEETVKQVCKLLKYSYRKPEESDDGFYLTSLNKKKCVVSLNDAVKKVDTGYGTNNGKITHRNFYPCYVNISDKTTLRFVLLIRPETEENMLEELDKKYPSL
jgi:hypothetical protein